MENKNYTDECKFIQSVIREAYEKYKDKEEYSCLEKKTFDVVTTVDYNIEKYIIERITNEYPDDRILSEETKSDTEVKGRTWTIDPIDGTYNYSNGIPLFGVQCSMFENGEPVVCALYVPVYNEMYYASKGAGAYLNGDKISVIGKDLDKCVVSFGDFPHSRANDVTDEQRIMNGINERIARVRMFGSACIDFAYLASGKTNGVVIFTKNKWDISPGILLSREAGALMEGENGEYTFDSRCVIAAASAELMRCIRKYI